MRVLSSLPSSVSASVWPADELACVADRVVATGHAALDAELPGGGWPLGALIELLQPAPTAAVWPLLLPALAERVRGPAVGVARRPAAPSARVVVVNPPHEPYVPALAAAGVPGPRLLWLAADAPAAQLWATEQALRCQHVAAVVAWLPRVQMGELRRLQQAAAQTGALLFVLRPDSRAAHSASPARVRLRVAGEVPPSRQPRLQPVVTGDILPVPRADPARLLPQLRIDLLKRRGPPVQQPLWLPVAGQALWAVMSAQLQGMGMEACALGSKRSLPRAKEGGADHQSLKGQVEKRSLPHTGEGRGEGCWAFSILAGEKTAPGLNNRWGSALTAEALVQPAFHPHLQPAKQILFRRQEKQSSQQCLGIALLRQLSARRVLQEEGGHALAGALLAG